MDKREALSRLADQLMRAEAPLFMNGELKDISNEISRLEGEGVLVAGASMHVHGNVGDDYRDLSPRDPLKRITYGFTAGSDARAWASKLQEYLPVRNITIT